MESKFLKKSFIKRPCVSDAQKIMLQNILHYEFSARERTKPDILTSALYISKSPQNMTLFMLRTCSIGYRPIWPITPLTKLSLTFLSNIMLYNRTSTEGTYISIVNAVNNLLNLAPTPALSIIFPFVMGGSISELIASSQRLPSSSIPLSLTTSFSLQ